MDLNPAYGSNNVIKTCAHLLTPTNMQHTCLPVMDNKNVKVTPNVAYSATVTSDCLCSLALDPTYALPIKMLTSAQVSTTSQHENMEDINTAQNIAYSKITKNLTDTDKNSDLTYLLEVNCASNAPSRMITTTDHPTLSHVNQQQDIELSRNETYVASTTTSMECYGIKTDSNQLYARGGMQHHTYLPTAYNEDYVYIITD